MYLLSACERSYRGSRETRQLNWCLQQHSLWEAPALFRQRTRNYFLHIPLPPSHPPSSVWEQHSKDLGFVYVGVSPRLPTAGNSLNGHMMRHTLKAKWSSCHRRTLFPSCLFQTPPHPFIPPISFLSHSFAFSAVIIHFFSKAEGHLLWRQVTILQRSENYMQTFSFHGSVQRFAVT